MTGERDALRESVTRRDDRGARELLARVGERDGAAPDEATALVARAQTGDAAARAELIERFLPLINSLARRYAAEGLEHADLVQEGCVGVLRALERFDSSRGAPFAAYASWWIRQALQEARSDFVRPLRLPPDALRQLARLKSEHDRVYAFERRDASAGELAERTSTDLAQVEALLAADKRTRSLSEPVEAVEGETGSLGDLLEDPVSADAYDEVLDAIAGQQLRALLGRLTERERDIVNARFGFDRPGEKLIDVAERLGISAERVRQLEERALVKLRHAA